MHLENLATVTQREIVSTSFLLGGFVNAILFNLAI